MCLKFLFLAICAVTCASARHFNGKIPHYLDFGVSTSAFQIEGAWNEDGKGLSMWDNFTHVVPSLIEDGSNADVAVDYYHRYKEDIGLAADLGVKYYRFSISWPRILPNGYADKINQKGIDFYKNVLKEILSYKMIPVATLYHWDLPQKLIEDGIDWTNPELIEHIVNYARIAIKNFPEVQVWNTLNEPKQMCHFGYGIGTLAPGIKSSGRLEYQCSYIAIKAHAAIYRMFKAEFPKSKALMSIAIDCQWIEPVTNEPEDVEAAERQMQFECGLYFHPIYRGDWPEIVKKRIRDKSFAANLTKSRLPEFTPEEIDFINGTNDFIAINHYYTHLASDNAEGTNEISYENDLGVKNSFHKDWVIQSNGIFTIVPFGVRDMLKWVKKNVGNKDIILTELGMLEDGKNSLIDDVRINFYKDYICNILMAIYQDGINVVSITGWSLLDNFEWAAGYTCHFGLYYINQKDPTLTRTPKKSVEFFKNLTKTRELDCDHLNRWPGPRQWTRLGPVAPNINLRVNGAQLKL